MAQQSLSPIPALVFSAERVPLERIICTLRGRSGHALRRPRRRRRRRHRGVKLKKTLRNYPHVVVALISKFSLFF